MPKVKEVASAFLANERVAVTGVSRTPKDHGSNTVYKRLRDRGYEVFAVNLDQSDHRPDDHGGERRRRNPLERSGQEEQHHDHQHRRRHARDL